ncbi:MAG: putative heme transporter [Solirubrobacterales bacterium]|nr:putative heme transporter [Solirubrobacterales bacterium]
MREAETKAAPEEVSAGLDFSDEEPSFIADPKKLLLTGIAAVVLLIGIYVLVPKLTDLKGAIDNMDNGAPGWLAAAVGFELLAIGCYVALFWGIVGNQIELHWRETMQINLAGIAANTIFSTGGAGGIILTYWALRKAGMERRTAANRMVSFLVMHYVFYLLALVVFGVLLRTGVLNGSHPVGLTIVPAAIGGVLLALLLATTLLPAGFERRIGEEGKRANFWGKSVRRLATVPATLADGTRTSLTFFRRPGQAGLVMLGAAGYWAACIGILWACFHAYDVSIPLGVVVMGFFVGMAANLFPFAPGGVGAVDAGMIGTFVLFGIPGEAVFTAVLAYRLIAFWLPIPFGIVAFFRLRHTVAGWEKEGRTAAGEAKTRARAAEVSTA